MTQLTGDGTNDTSSEGVHDDQSLENSSTIIGALNSTLRIRIVLALRDRDHVVHELVSSLGKSQPLISQHLRVLKHAGIVDSQRSGREVIYRLINPVAPQIIDLAADAGAENREPREAAQRPRDDLAAQRAGGKERQAGPVPTAVGKAAIVGPEDRAPDPGLRPSTPTPPDRATR